jgi:hypothetical protein
LIFVKEQAINNDKPCYRAPYSEASAMLGKTTIGGHTGASQAAWRASKA